MVSNPATSVPGRVGRSVLQGLAAVLILLALVLPTTLLLDVLSQRFRTVADFRSDYLRGLQALRGALALAGVVSALLPLLLRRAELARLSFHPPEGRDLVTASLLFLAAAGASFPGLFQSWQDDEWRVLEQYVRHGPGVILTRNVGDNQILHSLLVWPFTKVLGTSEIAVRLPVWLGGSLGAPFLFLLLRRSGHRWAPAGVTALLFALSPFLLQYLHESRAYALLPPCLFGLLILARPFLEGDPRAWLLTVVLAVACFLFHMFSLPVVVTILLMPLARAAERRPEVRFRIASALLAIGALSFLAYAPVLPQLVAGAGLLELRRVESLPPQEIFGRIFVMSLPVWTSIPFLGLLMTGSRPPRARQTVGAILFSLPLLVGLLLATSSELAPRYFVPVFSLAWILVAEGIGQLWPRPRWGLAAATLLLSLTLTADLAYYRTGNRDYRSAAADFDRRRSPGHTVAGRFDARPLCAYLVPPPAILNEAELQAHPPDWLLAVDVNLRQVPAFATWVERAYDEVFRFPSHRGALVGFRRK